MGLAINDLYCSLKIYKDESIKEQEAKTKLL